MPNLRNFGTGGFRHGREVLWLVLFIASSTMISFCQPATAVQPLDEPMLAPVDSVWELAHGDSLLFLHDGTNEFVRSTGSRELRFPGGRRLYFFTPRRFIESTAFLAKDFREVNHLPYTPRCIIKFRLAPGYSAPAIYYSGVHYNSQKLNGPAPTFKSKQYIFTVNFGEPDWYLLEITAHTTTKGKTISQIIARILICSGEPIPLPFDTLRESHAPAVLPRTDDRIQTLLNLDRSREGLQPLMRDTFPDEQQQLFIAALSDWISRHITYAIVTAHALRQFIPTDFPPSNPDSTLLGAIILSGENPEELCWIILASPAIAASGIFHSAASVLIAPMRDDEGLHVALVFRSKKT
jgi:hypothetical protein